MKNFFRFFPQIIKNWFAAFGYKRNDHFPVNVFNEPKIKVKDSLKVLPGSDWNPIKKYPRNESCYCGSGIKAKKCCLPNETLAISEEHAKHAAPLIRTMRSAK